ncbi:MAG: purine-cytosine permease family protein [Streptosporangiaceae bacterium]
MARHTPREVPAAVPPGREPAAQEYAAFKIEQRGIDLIPDEERKQRPSGLAWLWAGAVFNVEFFFYGTLIMFFGLTVWQAVAAVLIGNLFYALLGAASMQGPLTGTTAFIISRAPFGKQANRGVALFNWVTQVGFEIEGVYFVVATVILLFFRYGNTVGTPAKIGLIIVASLVQMLMPLFGHATISKVLRWLAYVFIALTVVLAVFIFQRLHLSGFHVAGASWAVWTTALVLIISVGGLGWTENGNDYSRYMPKETPRHKVFWAATIGGGVPSLVLELLGILAFTVTSKTVGITQLGVPQAFPSWFVTPFLIFAVVQLFCINTIDLYSSGVTLQALGLPVKRWGAVIIDTVVVAIVTYYVLFHGNFYQDFSGFLLYIVVWLAPWFGILMTDYVLRRARYDRESLAAERGGLYWRNGGVHWAAVIAQAVGMVAAMMWINASTAFPSYAGPLSNATSGSDFSWLIGIFVGAVLYWALAAHTVRKEAEETPVLT